MAKQMVFDDEARQPLLAGVSKLARAVRSTLGPRGRNAVLDKGWGSPKITKDGVTVAEEIELDDPYENLGAQLVKEAASKTNDVAGDGTTTATVLAEAIFREGLKMIASGADPMSLSRGIAKAVEVVKGEIDRIAIPIDAKSKKEIKQVATIAGNNDPTIGDVLAEAFIKVGKDGVIAVEEGRGSETTVEVVEGMQFDRGFLSPHFVTNQDEVTVELEDRLEEVEEAAEDWIAQRVSQLIRVEAVEADLLELRTRNHRLNPLAGAVGFLGPEQAAEEELERRCVELPLVDECRRAWVTSEYFA